MRGLVIGLIAFAAMSEVLCQSETNQVLRKRKIRKKVSVNPEPEPGESEEDRNARGFLDDYYSKYAQRVSQPTVSTGRQGIDSTERMDSYGYESDMMSDTDMSGSDMSDYQAAIQQMQMQQMIKKQEELEIALQQKKLEEMMIEDELHKLPKKAESMTRYVQHVALPKTNPDSNTYMFSTISMDDPTVNEIIPARSANSFVYAKPESSAESLMASEDKSYAYYTKDDSDTEEDVKRFFTDSSSDSYGAPSHNSDPVSRFFGVTGTTSQDIQLGLTFTVPFLSIPLTSLQSALDGGALGTLFDNFSFDSSSLVTVVVVAMLAIFVLPQVIYWLTGVNLSAFNWGRSDDEHGINVINMINMVDESLKKYDVDTKNCMARTMCNQYAERMLEGEEEAVQRYSRGLIENIAHHDYVKMFLGESKISEALSYGKNGKDCSIYYSSDICPWDTSAMIKIASKVMTSGNVDFASIATAAASRMFQSR